MIPDIAQAVEEELDNLRSNGKLEVRPEPRCRVCRDEEVRVLVNKMLAHGMTLRDINDVITPMNRKRSPKERINIHSIREHRKRHFDVQSQANSVYRSILEKRARELNVDYEEGIGSAVTHLAYLDTMIAKGFQTLVREDTVVSYRDGLDAALKRNELVREDAGAVEQARMIAEMDRVITVVKEVCTPEQLSLMFAKLNSNVVAAVPAPPPQRRQAVYDPQEDHDDFDDD